MTDADQPPSRDWPFLGFVIKGAGSEDFRVTVRRRGDYVTVKCTCPAGGPLKTCRHRIDLLNGILDNVIEESSADLAQLKLVIKGTELESAVAAVAAADRDLKIAQSLSREAKDYLALTMCVDPNNSALGIISRFEPPN